MNVDANLDEIREKEDFLKNQKKSVFLEEKYLLVDWIQATILRSDISVYELFKNLFGIESKFVVKEASGFFGYDTSYSYKDIRIMVAEYRRYEGLQDMGYHIYITGSGCRDLEDLNIDYKDLFKKILNYGAQFTRLDISVDCFTNKYFTIPRIKECIKNGQVVSRFRNTIEFVKTHLENGVNEGYTIWFGSRASDVQIVFYDKLKERQSQNYIVDNNINFWIRLECRFRRNHASEVASNFANKTFEEFKEFYFGVLLNYIRFVEINKKDKNKRRWKILPWWQEFVGDAKKISLQKINVESTITRKRNWCINSTSRNNFLVLLSEMELLTVDDVLGEFMYELFKTGASRISDHDLQYLNDLRNRNGMISVQKEEIQDLIKDINDYVRDKESMKCIRM